jgi:Uma2 family endonuclease
MSHGQPCLLSDDAKMAAMDGYEDMQPDSITKLTYEDFLSFPDDRQRHELIDGEHYVTPSPATKHQRVSIRLSGWLFQHFRSHPAGEVFAAPFDVVLSNHDVVEPDLIVLLSNQAEILTDKHVRGAPALVIEILSPATRRRDEGIKRLLYDRSGVREYWLVDLDDDAVAIWFRTQSGPLGRTALLRRADRRVLTSALLPDFALSLDELFA